MAHVLATIVSVVASLALSPALTQSSSNPTDRITVDVETVNGSGCPAGTATVKASSDNTSFTVTYSDYLAQDGAGAKPTDIRKNCQLSLLIHVPQGFTYAIAEADYRGTGRLAAGAKGEQNANYYFMGNSTTATVSHQFVGPFSGSWQTVDKADVASLVFAPCGVSRNLNINTDLRVDAGTSDPATTSYLSMKKTDGSIETVFHLAWKNC
jgi:hypothetical protein